MDTPLTDKRIGVVLESEYIPMEIDAYLRRFQELGAEVILMSNLWGEARQEFFSDAAPDQPLERIAITVDFRDVALDSLDALLMAANYCSVRLRYTEVNHGQRLGYERLQEAPAVRYFAEAMALPQLVKGFLCHALWILTPNPDLLKDRRVICHEVVAADVLNCGATLVPFADSQQGVVMDADLVTGHDVHVAADQGEGAEARPGPYINAIAERIRILRM